MFLNVLECDFQTFSNIFMHVTNNLRDGIIFIGIVSNNLY